MTMMVPTICIPYYTKSKTLLTIGNYKVINVCTTTKKKRKPSPIKLAQFFIITEITRCIPVLEMLKCEGY